MSASSQVTHASRATRTHFRGMHCLSRDSRPSAAALPSAFITHLAVAFHHDVIDVGLQGHADVLTLTGFKLEDVQHSSNAHFEKHRLAAAPKLHTISKGQQPKVAGCQWQVLAPQARCNDDLMDTSWMCFFLAVHTRLMHESYQSVRADSSTELKSNSAHIHTHSHLHDIPQLCAVQVLLGHRPEKVHAPLVDAQDEAWRQEADGVLNAFHSKEGGIAVWQGAQDAHELGACILLGKVHQRLVAEQQRWKHMQ